MGISESRNSLIHKSSWYEMTGLCRAIRYFSYDTAIIPSDFEYAYIVYNGQIDDKKIIRMQIDNCSGLDMGIYDKLCQSFDCHLYVSNDHHIITFHDYATVSKSCYFLVRLREMDVIDRTKPVIVRFIHNQFILSIIRLRTLYLQNRASYSSRDGICHLICNLPFWAFMQVCLLVREY